MGRKTARENHDQTIWQKITERILRWNNSFYFCVVGLGIVIMVNPTTPELNPIEGGAFIIAGLVGLIMAYVTGDVSSAIKHAIKQDGNHTRETIKQVIKEDGNRTRETIKQVIKEDGNRTRETIKQVIKEDGNRTRETIKQDGNRTRETIKQDGNRTRETIKQDGNRTRETIKQDGNRTRQAIHANTTILNQILQEIKKLNR